MTRSILKFAFSFALLAGTSGSASALTVEAAIESCRESVGKPRVMACVQNMVRTRGGPGKQYVETCRAPVKPIVQACVKAAMIKANGRADVPLAIATKKDDVKSELAMKGGFVVPPRTISDITAILDNEKPDEAKVAERKAKAIAEPEKGLSKADLAEFYLDRGYARADVGRVAEAIEDGRRAFDLAKDSHDPRFVARTRQFIGLQQNSAGDVKGGLAAREQGLKALENGKGAKGFLFNAYRQMVNAQVGVGDLSKAEAYVRRNEALLKEARTSPFPGWRKAYPISGPFWEGDIEGSRAALFEARGQYAEAEKGYAKSETWMVAGMANVSKMEFAPSEGQFQTGLSYIILAQARVKLAQGRLAEAEADARRALLKQLKSQGKYNSTTTRFINGLASQMVAQGRYSEAEKLIRTSLEILDTVGLPADSAVRVSTLEQLAGALNYQGKNQEATDTYRTIDAAIANWEPARRERIAMSGSRVTSLYSAGQIEEGMKLARSLLDRAIERFGADSVNTAMARQGLATGFSRSNQIEEAAREYKIAIPILMNAAREAGTDESGSNISAIAGRLKNVVESYIGMLARNPDKFDTDLAAETFALADAVRGQAVQGALGASAARAVAKDAALAEMVRKEQDSSKRIAAQQAALNNALASEVRDDNVIKATNAALATARKDLATTRAEINRRFPSYADLVNPKPPSIAQIQTGLKEGEALLSFYFGRLGSFVWAVPKQGKAAFAAIEAKQGDLETKIRKVRESLEPNAAMISEIPAFDIALASELYDLLLKPVESGWKESKSLIAVTNGALGLLPLSLLPTEAAQLDPNEKTLFESYRNVKWLARSHAVTMVPSSSALLTLRQLPKGREGRAALMAFGDPIFSAQQAEALAQAKAEEEKVRIAEATIAMRGVPLKRRNAPQLDGVDSAELAQLPRLPDTADELTSIAAALKVDPAKAVFLGKDANEASVKEMDLSGYKVLAFATHGLVPGELNGLTQPALAMSAPAVAGSTDGDGLLTMEEILALKLDADWVVLSACNTGAGSGAGAEAASGLGRAFFYAGTRALLVTNWSVHSQSARELVTDLFARQADDGALTRGEALRRAMMAMVDSAGFKNDAGEVEFAYAHPLFWAPYTIIGDTGGL